MDRFAQTLKVKVSFELFGALYMYISGINVENFWDTGEVKASAK